MSALHDFLKYLPEAIKTGSTESLTDKEKEIAETANKAHADWYARNRDKIMQNLKEGKEMYDGVEPIPPEAYASY